jgi:hypothetical protein
MVGVAQLVEHLVVVQDVAGSSPVTHPRGGSVQIGERSARRFDDPLPVPYPLAHVRINCPPDGSRAGRASGWSRFPDRPPLATVEIGIGNCNDGTEGAVAGTVIGTYPHGPVLARNPALADHVLELALGHELPPLVSPEIDKLRRQRVARVRRSNAHRRTRSRAQNPTTR